MVTSHMPEPTPNFARNSPEGASGFELCSLELQRFGTLLNPHPIELRAIFWGNGHIGTCWWRSWIPQTMCVVETGVAFAGVKWVF